MKKLLIVLLAAMLLTACSDQEVSEPTAVGILPTEPVASGDDIAIDPDWAWLLEEPTGPEATTVVLECSEQSLTDSLDFYFLMQEDQTSAKYMAAIAAARSYTVTACSQEGDTVTAQVTVCVPDMQAIMQETDLSGCQSVAETDDALSSAIAAAEPQTRQVTVQFTAGTNRWEPVMDAATTDAFFGGLITCLDEMTKEVQVP